MNQRCEVQYNCTDKGDWLYFVKIPTLYTALIANLFDDTYPNGEIILNRTFFTFTPDQYRVALEMASAINSLIATNDAGGSYTNKIREILKNQRQSKMRNGS